MEISLGVAPEGPDVRGCGIKVDQIHLGRRHRVLHQIDTAGLVGIGHDAHANELRLDSMGEEQTEVLFAYLAELVVLSCKILQKY